MKSLIKIFITFVFLPLVLGVFGEELFKSASNILTPTFLFISIIGSFVIVWLNKGGIRKISWYLISSVFILINLILLFLFFSFHPGF
ncbi:MAG: hypothetical protein A3B86_04850 [Candidatus Yanofskybacteria bacterium RIFCSPHIGHO2_02_FULL_38_22b]|uniref:Uncharacterized protein n=1 Tax=Candidatus Yanofskybacteria bacterium RIFCSPHIGHO2_02_FULL_38_22b TaxID=1802673 RepID=A0A1F8F5L8_9BACT|nr:MAG: hypothetical protein A2816_01385 [Candidatus Yanofskybacteria bacterium RIFCSPHIGHO2_01_FULL_39_44]OGN07549.1 MAG: hypothetical protein A3B86_04850 [Candidatus Yanofskybacteria bacterium RIFCSPHIGHO2_02_FULL_38_22b]OGN20163.1 MAG: hypothetical protein A2910_02175 [Candidatus Yanofskybacteria bacterium RIFCSPLOWO2_01_FULL_39_28]